MLQDTCLRGQPFAYVNTSFREPVHSECMAIFMPDLVIELKVEEENKSTWPVEISTF